MLKNDRIDLWVYGEEVSYRIIRDANHELDDYEKVFILSPGYQNCFAFNINTSDSLIQMFQKALDELKEEGVYREIINKYIE